MKKAVHTYLRISVRIRSISSKSSISFAMRKLARRVIPKSLILVLSFCAFISSASLPIELVSPEPTALFVDRAAIFACWIVRRPAACTLSSLSVARSTRNPSSFVPIGPKRSNVSQAACSSSRKTSSEGSSGGAVPFCWAYCSCVLVVQVNHSVRSTRRFKYCKFTSKSQCTLTIKVKVTQHVTSTH